MRRARTTPSLFLLFAFLSVAGFFLGRAGRLAPVQDVALKVSSPVETAIAGAANSVHDLLSGGSDLAVLRAQNTGLEQQVSQLTLDQVRLRAVETENAELRRLLNFAEQNPAFNLRAAQVSSPVIGQDPNNLVNSILIGIGKDQGARQNMPVVTERGLLGRIMEVSANVSKVLLITDPNSSVTAVLQNSRLKGVVRGQTGNGLLMDFIPQDAPVQIGDIVLTSGLGGMLPRDLVIGQVVEVRRRDFEPFQQAVVRPTVDFGRMEKVLVITNYPLPSADPSLSAGADSGPGPAAGPP